MNTEPTKEDLESPAFNAVWEAIKKWDLDRGDISTSQRCNYAGATGTDVMTILNALHNVNALSPTPNEDAQGERPTIKQFFGEDTSLTEVMETYHSQPQLFNYAQALDRYIDEWQGTQSPEPGLKWVKASEKFPEDDSNRHVKIDGIPRMGNFFWEKYQEPEFYVSGDNSYTIPYSKFSGIEWLSEPTAQQPKTEKEGEGISNHIFAKICAMIKKRGESESLRLYPEYKYYIDSIIEVCKTLPILNQSK